MELPAVETRTLQGAPKLLPDDLPAQRTLVVLAFQQRHQRDVDEWMAIADRRGWLTDLSDPGSTSLGGSKPSRAVIEVPCISRRWGPVRRFIDGGMATTIAVPEVLARTWTAYTDVGRVQRALQIADSGEIWVAVVEDDGTVTESVVGPPTEATEASIAHSMDAPDGTGRT